SAAFFGPISSLHLTASSLNALSYRFIASHPLVNFHFISYEGVFRLHFYRSTPGTILLVIWSATKLVFKSNVIERGYQVE
ncbi:hypothetical protein ACH6EH_10880, partial [Paenibacillus sp. JSM ZJ436]|uniref:hypothetical protein n=1 Tax=Paenibacillus sp. JSM ZJ436 TaxID=3376190 RepID=UPI00378B7A10